MKAIVYFSLSKKKSSKKIALEVTGEHFEIIPVKKTLKCVPMQMFYYGYLTVANKSVDIVPIDIDLNSFDEITLVSPVWGGQVNVYMRQFLLANPLKNKKITIIGSCSGGYKNYFSSYDKFIDSSNEIIEKIIYVKGIKI
jgi:hypothetical protein